MLAQLLNGNPEVVTARMPWLLLPAFLSCYLCARFNLPGLLTFMQMGAMAASGATLTHYRTERGLWMLATLFFAVWTGIFGVSLYGALLDAWRGIALRHAVMIDAAISTLLMKTHLSFLWKASRENYRLTRTAG